MRSLVIGTFLVSSGLLSAAHPAEISRRDVPQDAELLFFNQAGCNTVGTEFVSWPTILKTPKGTYCWQAPDKYTWARVKGEGCTTIYYSDTNCQNPLQGVGNPVPDTKCYAGLGSASTWCSNPGDAYKKVPTKDGGAPDDKGWRDIDCSNNGVTDALQPQQDRWSKTRSEDAWTEAIANFKKNPTAGFIQSMMNFTHGPESMSCGAVAERDGCEQDVQCIPGTPPAGMMIANSLINTNNVFVNIYESLKSARDAVQGYLPDLTTRFTPDPKPTNTEALDLLFDFVGLGFAMGIAPVWSHVLKEAKYFQGTNKPYADDIKDETNGIVSNGLKIVHDTVKTQDEAFDKNAALSVLATNITSRWMDTIGTHTQKIFDGTDDGISQLHTLIGDGKMLEVGKDVVSEIEVANNLTKMILMRMMQPAWSLSGKGLNPVVLFKDNDPGCNAALPKLNGDISGGDSKFQDNDACVNDQRYYLLSATGGAIQTSADAAPGTPLGALNWKRALITMNFSPLDGVDALDGKTWTSNGNGITRQDVIEAAVNTWRLNDNKNGVSIDTGDADMMNQFANLNVRAPGIVTVPVCTFDEANRNWKAGKPNENSNWPCNK